MALVKEEEGKANGATILVDGGRATRCGTAFANSKLMRQATAVTEAVKHLVAGGRYDRVKRSRKKRGSPLPMPHGCLLFSPPCRTS
jgi:hypothetical protein